MQQVQYPLPKKADFMVIDESRNGKPVAAHMLPAYWTNVKIPDRLYTSLSALKTITKHGFIA